MPKLTHPIAVESRGRGRSIAWAFGAALLLVVTLAGACKVTTEPSNSRPTDRASGAPAALWNGTDLLWDASYDASGFVAVGNSGVVVTSADGRRWLREPRVTSQTLRGVATGDGLVVAVGTGGTVVSWPEAKPNDADLHPIATTLPLLGVAYGDGMWVVAGSSGMLLTSSDLRHWTRRDSGTDGDIFAVAFAGGTFVAVSDIGSIVVSPDGIHWHRTRPADGLWLWSVTHGASGFVAVGADGAALQSADGNRWVRKATGTTQALRGIAFARGQYLAVGSDATVVSSSNGSKWTSHPISDVGVELWRPAASPGAWLAVGAGGTRLLSMNLQSWTGGHSTRTAFYGVGAHDQLTLATGVNGTIARRESDGGWVTIAAAPGRRELRSITYLGRVWVVTGGGGSILTSLNGARFTPGIVTSTAELWSSAVLQSRAHQRLVVVGAGGTILISDDDGRQWRSAANPSKATLFSVAAGPSGLVAVGVDGTIVNSTDGEHWRVVPGHRLTLRAVASDGHDYVAVGASGTVLTSSDGEHWVRAPQITSQTLRAVTKIADEWVAVGGGGTIIRSTDPHTWHSTRSPTNAELFAVSRAQGSGACSAIAVAGIDASILTSDCGRSWMLVAGSPSSVP